MHKIISEDNFIWEEHKLTMYLYRCLHTNIEPVLDFFLEGPCARTNGLYQLLDSFCNENNYSKEKITIRTGNVIEKHQYYKIKKNYEYWYELKLIQDWLKKNTVVESPTPSKHFGNFVGRSTWARLWIASHLYTNHKDKILQTFHSGLQKNYVVPESDGLYDIIGLDNLIRYGCNSWNQVNNFLQSCPITLNDDYDATVAYIAPSNKNYPIQYPANMNILNHYKNFCIDIVAETRVNGNLFFATEKIWRPIIARRPFIVIGPGNFLKNLKKMGFRTFNDFWDEGYDEYDSEQRVKNIINLIDDLTKLPITELHNMLNRMHDILENNYQVFCSLSYQKIKEIFDE